MGEPNTPDLSRAKAIAELMALPGPKPLKPIPTALKVEALDDAGLESEDEVARQVAELMSTGGVSIQPFLEDLDRRVASSK